MSSRHEKESGMHLIVGSGAVGGALARSLNEEGSRVVVVTRSGTGPTGVERIAADAGDAEVMARLARGATAIYNCANPPYHRWPTDWPPISRSLLAAAQRNGAVLVTLSNLYGYGPASLSIQRESYDESSPMTENTPLATTGIKGQVRAQMWRDALDAHESGRVRAVEVRASDYIGSGEQSVVGARFVPRVLRGKSMSVLGRTDRLHTWSFTEDVARMMALVGSDSRAWGHAWHVPSNAPRTQREIADDLARAANVATVRVRALPSTMLHALGIASPLMRELRETEYQFREDFVMDSSAATSTFALAPTPWDEVLGATLRTYGFNPEAAKASPDFAQPRSHQRSEG